MNKIADGYTPVPEEERIEVPENFIELFTEFSLPIPPIPKKCVRNLIQVGPWLFATKPLDQRVANLLSDRVFMEDLDFLSEVVFQNNEFNDFELVPAETQEDKPEYYFACGMYGYGLQGWRFHYILLVKNFRFFVSLPYGSVYSDNEEERKQISLVNTLLELCLMSMDLYSEEGFKVDVTVDADSCRWARYDLAGELLKSSDSVHTLIDELQLLRSEGSCVSPGSGSWLRI